MHLVTLIPSFISFKYNYILESLSYWGPTFAHTWDAQNEMLWYGYALFLPFSFGQGQGFYLVSWQHWKFAVASFFKWKSTKKQMKTRFL